MKKTHANGSGSSRFASSKREYTPLRAQTCSDSALTSVPISPEKPAARSASPLRPVPQPASKTAPSGALRCVCSSAAVRRGAG